MKQAVVVSSWWGGWEQLAALLRSLSGCKWPIYIVVNGLGKCDPKWLEDLASSYNLLTRVFDEYELGTLASIMDETDLDEWVMWQDTFEMKSLGFLDGVFAYDGSVALSVAGFHYNMKWRREVLERLRPLPTARNKDQSIHWEHTFSRMYFEAEDKPIWTFDEHFHDGENQGFVEMYGRRNMVLENEHYRKLKGTFA